jgi:predicted DNA-binding transcriptional regulator AlpA
MDLFTLTHIARKLAVPETPLRQLHYSGLLPQPLRCGMREMWTSQQVEDIRKIVKDTGEKGTRLITGDGRPVIGLTLTAVARKVKSTAAILETLDLPKSIRFGRRNYWTEGQLPEIRRLVEQRAAVISSLTTINKLGKTLGLSAPTIMWHFERGDIPKPGEGGYTGEQVAGIVKWFRDYREVRDNYYLFLPGCRTAGLSETEINWCSRKRVFPKPDRIVGTGRRSRWYSLGTLRKFAKQVRSSRRR